MQVEVKVRRDAKPWYDYPWSASVVGTPVQSMFCATRWGALWLARRRYKAWVRSNTHAERVYRNW